MRALWLSGKQLQSCVQPSIGGTVGFLIDWNTNNPQVKSLFHPMNILSIP